MLKFGLIMRYNKENGRRLIRPFLLFYYSSTFFPQCGQKSGSAAFGLNHSPQWGHLSKAFCCIRLRIRIPTLTQMSHSFIKIPPSKATATATRRPILKIFMLSLWFIKRASFYKIAIIKIAMTARTLQTINAFPKKGFGSSSFLSLLLSARYPPRERPTETNIVPSIGKTEELLFS